jgi:glycosyltransferase involved in cell wall biosynthesis
MKIAFITELFPPSIGGQEVRYAELIPHLVERGHEVSLACIDHQGDLPEQETHSGAAIYRLVRDSQYKQKGKFFPRNPKTILKFRDAARAWLKKENPDVVIYNQWPIVPAFTGRKDAKLSILDICEFRSGAAWNWMETKMVRGCHRVITVSQSLADITARRWPGTVVKAIPSGINVNNYQNLGREHFLFMGRLEPHKNPEIAIEATLEYNRMTGENKKIVVVGGGVLKPELQAKYEGHPNVQICGFVSDEEKMEILNKSELHLLPSIREGFPRGIAECMACGTPTVTTEAPDNGSKDVVRYFNVGVVTELGVKPFAEGIASALKDYETYSENCEKEKWQLDWGRLAENLVEFIEQGR